MKRGGAGAPNDALPPDFADFIDCLNEARVAFVLVGGYALAIYGVVRATGDIDFLFRRTRANVDRLCAALERFGAPVVVIDRDALMQRNLVSQFGRPPHRIDLLNEIDGVSFQRVWRGSQEIEMGGRRLRVIGRDELRDNKVATGRPKDAEDARKLADRGKSRGARR